MKWWKVAIPALVAALFIARYAFRPGLLGVNHSVHEPFPTAKGGSLLSKLPRFEKKLRVALDWTLDPLFSKDILQFSHESRNQYVSYSRQDEDRSVGPREAGRHQVT